jgi:hypothetical protein
MSPDLSSINDIEYIVVDDKKFDSKEEYKI